MSRLPKTCEMVSGDERWPRSTTPLEVHALTAGDRSTCAIVDGTVYCFGPNESGQIGAATGERCDGVLPCVRAPRAMLDCVLAIEASFSTVCAIHEDGTLWC